VAIALLLLAPLAAQAQDCHVSGAFGMDFGQVTGSGKAATSSVAVVCAPDYSGAGRTFYYQMCLSMAPGGQSAGQPTRRMTNHNNAFLNYDLFSDPAHTQKIGPAGTTPIYRFTLAVPPGSPRTAIPPIHGWVYPGQSVPATSPFQEQGIEGQIRYRHDTSGFPASTDCSTGGAGGGSMTFNSSGVYATFDNSCWIVATPLDFGQTPPPQQAVTGNASIRFQCPPNTVWRVGLNDGLHASGGLRRMSGSGGHVRYELYRDANRSQVWGNTTGSMASGVVDAVGNMVNLTVYGQVPAQPDVVPGTYTDTVTLTLIY